MDEKLKQNIENTELEIEKLKNNNSYLHTNLEKLKAKIQNLNNNQTEYKNVLDSYSSKINELQEQIEVYSGGVYTNNDFEKLFNENYNKRIANYESRKQNDSKVELAPIPKKKKLKKF